MAVTFTTEDARDFLAEHMGQVFVLPDTAPFDDYQLVALRGRWAVFESRKGGVRQMPVREAASVVSRITGRSR